MPPITPPFNQRLNLFNQARRQYGRAFGSGVPQLQQGGGGFSTLPQQPSQDGGWQSIQDQVLGIVNPQLQNAADMINRRSQMASQLISGYTNSYKGLVGGTAGQMPGFYKPEIKIAKGVAGYSRDALVNTGISSAAGLTADLSQAGVHGPGDINLTQQGAGAGAAAYGTGIAELDALIARKAAQSAESALEPSFAAGMGTQQQGIVAAQLARQLADLQGNIASQVPGLVSDLTERAYQHQQDLAGQQYQRETDARDYAERVREYNQNRTDQITATKQANAASLASAQDKGDTVAYGRARDTADRLTKNSPHVYLAVRGKNGNWTVQDMGPKAGKAATPTKFQHVTVNGTAYGFNPKTGQYLDPVSGKPVTPTGKPKAAPGNLTYKNVRQSDGTVHVVGINPKTGKQVVDVGLAGTQPAQPTPKGGAKPLTQSQLQKQITTWHQGVVSQTTTTNAKGDQSVSTTRSQNPISYQQALTKLRGMGKSEAEAHSLLDPVYKRGELGRPWLGPTARSALAKAGLPPRVRYTGNPNKGQGARKSIPVLTAAQVKVLRAAGALPPGAWAQGPSGEVYVVGAGY